MINKKVILLIVIVILLVIIFFLALNKAQNQTTVTLPSTTNTATSSMTTQPTRIQCIPNWECSDWSSCSSNQLQTRTCVDGNNCNSTAGLPVLSQFCIPSTTKPGTCSTNADCPQGYFCFILGPVAINQPVTKTCVRPGQAIPL